MARTGLFRELKKVFQLAHGKSHGARPEAEFENRRDFLKSTLWASTLASPIAQLSNLSSAFGVSNPPRNPVMILGAGASGLAAAFTLKKAGIPFHIFEASSRVGGRVFTKENFNQDGQFIECGAELVDTDHKTLMGLARTLNLEIENIMENNGMTREIYYIGGKVYTKKQLFAGVSPLVGACVAASNEINAGDDGITYKLADNPAAVKYDRMTLKEFLDQNSKPQNPNGVDSWVREVIEVAYITEYGRESDQQSAYNLISLFAVQPKHGLEMFGSSDEAFRVKGGNSKLTEALFKSLGNPDDFISYNQELVKIEEKNGKIICYFRDPGNPAALGAAHYASQIICTIPFSILRNVEGLSTLDLSPRKLRCIQELGYGHCSKVCISFEDRFWRETSPEVPPSAGYIYSDFSSQSFWETTRAQKGKRGILTCYLGGAPAVAASELSINNALSDLSELFPMTRAKYEKGLVLNWTNYPWVRGCYTSQLPGQYTSFWGAQCESELDGRLLFAGEHVSLAFAGFMEGAYETGIQAAQTAIKNFTAKKKTA